MNDVLKTIQVRQSNRAPFNPRRAVGKDVLKRIVEAARWAPTPHNMQNFEIIVVDDKTSLKKIGEIKSSVSEIFVRENYFQLSSSKEELLKKKVGILGTHFPPAWRDPTRFDEVLRERKLSTLSDTIDGSPAILIVVYDTGKRAPASEGDFLGVLGLGCVLENMWLEAQALKIGFQVMSVFGGREVEKELKRILAIPSHMRIAYAIRLGFSVYASRAYLRVRRDAEDIVYHNRYGIHGLD
jgi:nitroreductase